MILSFSTTFKNGDLTHFIDKIFSGLLRSEDLHASDIDPLRRSLNFEFQKKLIPISAIDAVSYTPKRHTIREDKTDRWKAGMKIHPVVFSRSKKQFQFAPTMVCKSVQKIEIFPNPSGVTVIIEEEFQTRMDIERLARNDGFASYEDFAAYFKKPFEGKIIHWTNLKY